MNLKGVLFIALIVICFILMVIFMWNIFSGNSMDLFEPKAESDFISTIIK
ncbi:hypothetical protein KZO01_23010 [Kurthia zopfii]|uniref:Uncharacterized protein n=1 Tax=Kurthia zopfii TaxID=1650 RepID=A0A8B4Q8I9_9BACL|nr:hypothetical protein [Kurthia zopfii]TDR33815.1 hypothetical protein DFR61_14819 [Kurthia zopfii]GEK31992.1 hypothetical protein KZO01_23010 [Kurthia zopfii]STX08875.1 Uncharacterised protein [Kurthia zopfii]